MSNSNKTSSHTDLISGLVDNLFNFQNSEVLKVANHVMTEGHKVMDKLDEKYHIEPMNIDVFLQKMSPSIDEKVLETAKLEHTTPVGGEIKLSIEQSSGHVLAVWEFYFIDSKKQYKKINSQKVFDKDFFTVEAYTQIKNTSPTFNIEAP